MTLSEHLFVLYALGIIGCLIAHAIDSKLNGGEATWLPFAVIFALIPVVNYSFLGYLATAIWMSGNNTRGGNKDGK